MKIEIKRIYEEPAESDGYRVLVDRLWSRGLSKDKAHIDLWAKEIAPSVQLRRWFHHDPAKWAEFKKRYNEELKQNELAPSLQAALRRHKKVTLVYSAKDTEHNNAEVLREFLEKMK